MDKETESQGFPGRKGHSQVPRGSLLLFLTGDTVFCTRGLLITVITYYCYCTLPVRMRGGVANTHTEIQYLQNLSQHNDRAGMTPLIGVVLHGFQNHLLFFIPRGQDDRASR